MVRDDGEGDEVEEEIGPDDPDYDLSEAHGYTWEPARENWPVPRWLLAVVSILVVLALVVPGVIFFLQHA